MLLSKKTQKAIQEINKCQTAADIDVVITDREQKLTNALSI